MKETVIITEVGLRDGLQNQPNPVSTDQKIQMALALIEAGVTHLEAASFVHPKAVPQMADSAEVLSRLPERTDLTVSALVPNMKGYQRAKDCGVSHIGVVLASTDSFNLKNLNMTLAETQAVCEQVIAQAKADQIKTRAFISGAFACPYDGKTPIDIVHKLTEAMIAAGADEISIADTIGAGNPQQVIDIMKPLIAQYGADLFNLHLHDTRGQALAMAWAGIEQGVRRFDSSIGGLGGCPFAPGATGNVATEDLVYMLQESGFDTGIDINKLKPAVAAAEQATGQSLGGNIIRWMKSQELRQARNQAACV